MSTSTPHIQDRNQFPRDWGNFTSLTLLPNASAYAGTVASVRPLERGDTAFVDGVGRVYCVSAGTPGALDAVWNVPGSLLHEFPISPASVGTPVFVRYTTDAPVGPVGVATSALVAAPSMPGLSCLQLASTDGCWVWPLRLPAGLSLPSDGYTLELEISNADAGGWYAMVMPLGDLIGGGSPSARGFFLYSYYGATNVDTFFSEIVSGPYYKMTGVISSITAWGASYSAANFARGPFRMVIDVRRTAGLTPSQWSIRVTLYAANGQVSSSMVSNVTLGLTALDGAALSSIGLGTYGAGAAQICLQRIRLFSLGSN